MVDVSMGIYIFNTDVLLPELIKDAEDPDSKHDFGHDILPNILGRVKMHAYNFVDENKQKALYWRDVGTLEAYYEANMDVAGVTPIFNLYDKSWPMRSRPYQYPPAKFVFGEPGRTGMAINSIVSNGTIVSGSVVRNSVVSQGRSCQLLRRRRLQHHLRPRQHRPPTAASATPSSTATSHIPDGTVIGYDPNRRQEELLRLTERPHRRHPRLLRLRKPRLPGVHAARQLLVKQKQQGLKVLIATKKKAGRPLRRPALRYI